MSIHIDTQAQTCTQTNTDVLRSSWYFHVFLGGLIFHARPLLIFPRLFNLCCCSCWCHGRALAFHTLTKVLLFFLMGLYMKQGARCQVAMVVHMFLDQPTNLRYRIDLFGLCIQLALVLSRLDVKWCNFRFSCWTKRGVPVSNKGHLYTHMCHCVFNGPLYETRRQVPGGLSSSQCHCVFIFRCEFGSVADYQHLSIILSIC